MLLQSQSPHHFVALPQNDPLFFKRTICIIPNLTFNIVVVGRIESDRPIRTKTHKL